MQPIIIATQKGYPKAIVFCNPAIVNKAKPKVSNANQALSNRRIRRPNKMTKSNAAAVQRTYIVFVIQKGVAPSIKSLMVPPPIATANPHT